MSSSGAMLEGAELRLRYYAKAKQFLYDQDRLEYATEDELANTADYLRYQDFRAAILPIQHQKERMVSRFFMLQTNPNKPGAMPEELRSVLAQWDELIAIEARKFGYEMPADQP